MLQLTDEQQLRQWLKRGETEVFSVITMMTPAMARILLMLNTDNRPIIWKGSIRSVAAYAAAMKRGEWALNGEAVIVSASGEVNDGQHRLNAVVNSEVSVLMQITFGVERDTRHTVDQGIARSPGHILAMAGEKNYNVLASALQFMFCHDEGVSLHTRPSTDQLLATLVRHPTLRDAVSQVAHLSSEFRLSTGYLAGAYYLCRRHNEYSADQWLSALTTGLNIQNSNSPVARLRKMLTEHSAKRRRLSPIEQVALIIKGYNLFLRGRTGSFSWRANGPAPEAFPVAGA